MIDKNYKRKYEFQKKMNLRQSEMIEKLNARVEELETMCKEKDIEIKSIDSLRAELSKNVDDVKQGIIASKIAAHAADIAKKIPHARDIDDRMGDARRNLDWEEQWACALDPETAKRIRDERKPEHEDTCSMCGKFCAVRSMNKALNNEMVDIL